MSSIHSKIAWVQAMSLCLVLTLCFCAWASTTICLDEDGCSISGTVINNKGKPVNRAKVDIICSDLGYKERLLTDKQGQFSVEQLKPGYYRINLFKGRYWSSRHKMQHLEAGQKLTIEFKPFKNTAIIFGRVLDLKDKPIPDCTVSASLGSSGMTVTWTSFCFETITDKEGYFVLENLEPKTFDLSISKEGLLHKSWGGKYTLDEGVEHEVTIKMHPGTLKVMLEADEDVPSDIQTIRLEARKDEHFYPKWFLAASPQDNLEIKNLPAGSFIVTAFAKGYYSEPKYIKIKKNKKPVELPIKLLKAGSILFKVTDREGNPVKDLNINKPEGGRVRLIREKGIPTGIKPVPGKNPFSGGDEVDMEKVSDGQFCVYSLPPGEHIFDLNSSAGSKSRLKVNVKSGEETVVTVVFE